MTNQDIWNLLNVKHPERKPEVSKDSYGFKPEEEFHLKGDNILPKLDMNSALGPSRLRNSHLIIWMGVYAPPAADEAVEHLELLILDMANDEIPPWFIHAMEGTALKALAKEEARNGGETESQTGVDTKHP